MTPAEAPHLLFLKKMVYGGVAVVEVGVSVGGVKEGNDTLPYCGVCTCVCATHV